MSENIRLRIGKEDRERLEFVAAIKGTSLSGAARQCIRAAYLLLTKRSPDDLLKEK